MSNRIASLEALPAVFTAQAEIQLDGSTVLGPEALSGLREQGFEALDEIGAIARLITELALETDAGDVRAELAVCSLLELQQMVLLAVRDLNGAKPRGRHGR